MAVYTAINDPSAYFQTVLHSSANAATITNDGNSDLQPDFIWSKARGEAYNHGLYDSTRGVTKLLSCNTDSAEATASSGFDLTSFNTDGFSTGNNQFNTICGGTDYVAWQWKAGAGSTSTNSDGDINSTVQVNTTAGFSIVTYNPSNTTTRNIGHGLGVKPDFIIIRNRTRAESWRVWFSTIGQGAIMLNSNGTYTVNSNLVNSVTTSTFNVGGDFSVNGNYPYVAYCFNEVQGYSKFGSYVGNANSTNGPFTNTGFKPAFVMIKNKDATADWAMFDNKRNPHNVANLKVSANEAHAENDLTGFGATENNIDMLSNGFKCRTDDTATNANAETFVYMAFAENPFVTSTGIPTTAR